MKRIVLTVTLLCFLFIAATTLIAPIEPAYGQYDTWTWKGECGAKIDNNTNNVITFTENSEDLTMTFSSNAIAFSSSTGLSRYTFGGGIIFNEDENRTGEGSYLFANGLPIGMTTPGDCQGIKMEFDYGVTAVVTGSGKTATGMIIKFVMDTPWNFTSADRNAVVRGAMIHGESEDNVGGRVQGLYCNAKATGVGKEIEGYFADGSTSAGLISIEARTELNSSCTLTTPRVVGLLCFHNQKTGSSLTGEYAAIQIDQPLTGTMTGDKYGILFTDDHATGYPYKYAFGFENNMDLDTTAHYSANMTTSAISTNTVDGWISVDIDGNQLYIWLWAEKPT